MSGSFELQFYTVLHHLHSLFCLFRRLLGNCMCYMKPTFIHIITFRQVPTITLLLPSKRAKKIYHFTYFESCLSLQQILGTWDTIMCLYSDVQTTPNATCFIYHSSSSLGSNKLAIAVKIPNKSAI